MKPYLSAVILIVLGTLFLLQNLDLLDLDLGDLLSKWWPLILIAAGVGMLFRQRGAR